MAQNGHIVAFLPKAAFRNLGFEGFPAQSLALYMSPQHQLLGVQMQIHLLVQPVGHGVAKPDPAIPVRIAVGSVDC